MVRFKNWSSASTALLCILLTLNLHLWPAGCATGPTTLADGSVLIPLGADHPIKAAFSKSKFGSTNAMVANPTTGEFHLVYSDDAQQLSGKFQNLFGTLTLTDLSISNDKIGAQIQLDSGGRITQISTSTGLVWQRPADWSGYGAKPKLDSSNAFASANQELVDLAAAMDQAIAQTGGSNPGNGGNGATGGDGSGVPVNSASKTINAQTNNANQLSSILGIISALLGLQLIIWNLPTLDFLFKAFVLFQITLAILNIHPGTTSQPAGGGTTSQPSGSGATLRVTNALSATPIWYVVLVADPAKNLPGGNLLGDESIPAGSSRDFDVTPGTRDIILVTPSGRTCFVQFANSQVVLVSADPPVGIGLDANSKGDLFPSNCDNNGSR